MQKTLQILLRHLENTSLRSTNVIPWSCPVPVFGDLSSSVVATLGLNPSNREFLNIDGTELNEEQRRLHTLNSLGLGHWSDANENHINLIIETCRSYFNNNPYNTWFKSLDTLISGTQTSYYHNSNKACHFDLIPYATTCKWTDLTSKQRYDLLEISSETLGLLLIESSVQFMILNGASVVESLQAISGEVFNKVEIAEWELPRKKSPRVRGYAYSGTIDKLSGIKLNRKIKILGFNHNIQSSFGVTSQIKNSIKNWITNQVKEGV